MEPGPYSRTRQAIKEKQDLIAEFRADIQSGKIPNDATSRVQLAAFVKMCIIEHGCLFAC